MKEDGQPTRERRGGPIQSNLRYPRREGGGKREEETFGAKQAIDGKD